MLEKRLDLVVDMYGCPNRCRHCWIGHMPNRRMDEKADEWIVDYFRPYFRNITFYSWLREPDFCDDYKARWQKDIQLSINSKPMRFELASFWRIVRDEKYVKFLKEVGVKKVQLTFFGMEELTDKYVGRKGAYKELLKATEILIENGIAPRWQVFINEENKDEIIELLALSKKLELKEKCNSFHIPFEFFIHAGSCDGENEKLYDIRINRGHVPEELRSYYLEYDKTFTERECIEILKAEASSVIYHNDNQIVLYISNTYDVYFNFTHMSKEWKIGNLKEDNAEDLIQKIVEEDIEALKRAKEISVKELVEKYGDNNSEKLFFLNDYKGYLLNCYLRDSIK